MLLTFSDFLMFKEMFLDYRAVSIIFTFISSSVVYNYLTANLCKGYSRINHMGGVGRHFLPRTTNHTIKI